MLQLIRRQLLEICQRMIKDFAWNRGLNVRGLSLDTFVADGGKFIQLVRHTAALATHSQATGLARITAVQRLSRVQQADAPNCFQRVEDLFGATAHNSDGLCGDWLIWIFLGHNIGHIKTKVGASQEQRIQRG